MTGEPLDYAPPTLPRRKRWIAVWIVLLIVALFLIFSAASPWLNWRNEPGQRQNCASNLREIGEAIALYADENNGWLPPDLRTLAGKEDLSPGAFVCPASSDIPATQGSTAQATANNIMQPGHESYIYVGAGLQFRELNSTTVLAYEPLSNHGAGMNVLFGNFHVEWLDKSEAQKLLHQQTAGTRPIR